MGSSISTSGGSPVTSVSATDSNSRTNADSKAPAHQIQRKQSDGALSGLMPLAKRGTVGELQNAAAAAFAATTGASPALVDAAHDNPAMAELREQPMTSENLTELCRMETEAARNGDQSIWQNRLAASGIADMGRHAAAQITGLHTSLGRDGAAKTHVEGGWNVHEDVIGVHGG
ncbi:hypothetical protein WS86_22765 [Burkholderia savannae]|uniref:hypothetical protein n=1 Tax=Burkholderia savannae TaxID=1637837 RepID=UPI0008561930|nr:hypothetical protein [Burkholderia savannae]AOJ83490.1 hypothetical protein WS86_22765 [Burkholderia savannae]